MQQAGCDKSKQSSCKVELRSRSRQGAPSSSSPSLHPRRIAFPPFCKGEGGGGAPCYALAGEGCCPAPPRWQCRWGGAGGAAGGPARCQGLCSRGGGRQRGQGECLCARRAARPAPVLAGYAAALSRASACPRLQLHRVPAAKAVQHLQCQRGAHTAPTQLCTRLTEGRPCPPFRRRSGAAGA